jgi:carbon-monoxide dehydrogenase medium subunit
VLNEIKKSPVVQERAPVLAEAIGVLASNPIRNRATIGGNLCNASPAADTAPPLLALDASLTLMGSDSERVVPISEFFVGPGQTVKRPDEVVKDVIIPLKKGRSAFLKLGRRKGFTLSIASVAAFGVITDGKFDDLRVALGAVAPTPIRSLKVEEALVGMEVSEERIEKAARLVKEEVNPITDVRASAAYRKEMSYVLTKRVLKKIAMWEV